MHSFKSGRLISLIYAFSFHTGQHVLNLRTNQMFRAANHTQTHMHTLKSIYFEPAASPKVCGETS